MSILKSKKFHTYLGWSISIGLLVWIANGLDWKELGQALLHVNYWILIPLTIFFLLHYFLRAFRSRFLLPPGAVPPTRILFDALMIGNMASYLLPLRAGEFLRPYLLSKDSSYSFAVTFSSVVIERFFDLAMVLVLLSLVSPHIPELPFWAQNGTTALSFVGGAIFVFMIFSAFFPSLVLKAIDLFLNIVPARLHQKGHDFFKSLMEGAAVLRSPKRLFATIGFTLLVWATVWVMMYLGLMMLNITTSAALLALTLTVIVALAVAAPSAPGFIGVFQTAFVASFFLFSLPKEDAMACSLVLHSHQFLCICSYGAWALAKRGQTLSGTISQEKLHLATLEAESHSQIS